MQVLYILAMAAAHLAVIGVLAACWLRLRALQQHSAKQQLLIDTAADAIVTINARGIVETFNHSAERLFGYSAEEVIGRNVSMLIPSPHREEHDEYLLRFLRTGVKRIIGMGRELYGINKDGVAVPIYLRITQFEVGGRMYFTAVIRDNTAKKQSEDELRGYAQQLNITKEALQRHNHVLETQIKEQTAELRAATDAAIAANKAKNDFLANMSHELRTPLHAVLSFARIGAKKHALASPARLRRYFERIVASGETLLRLLDELLDIEKLEAGKMLFYCRQTSLAELVEQTVDEFSEMCAERDIKIAPHRPHEELWVHVDAERFAQVLRNLLANAVKFSPPGGTVLVELTRGDDCALISVADEGEGIPEAELEAVFDKFVQSSKTNSGAGGAGLGLSICRQIVDAHGGAIWADNGVHGGAVFRVRIPLASEDGAPPPEALTAQCAH